MPRSIRALANPRRALSLTGAGRSGSAKTPRKISEASEGRFCVRRTRPSAQSSSAGGSRDRSRAAWMAASASAADGSPPASCRSINKRRVSAFPLRGSEALVRRARACTGSPCSSRIRASSSVASGDVAAWGWASLAAPSRLPWAAAAAARSNTVSTDVRSHVVSSVRCAVAGSPASSCARARSSPRRCFSFGPAPSRAVSSGAIAACGNPSRMADSAISSAVGPAHRPHEAAVRRHTRRVVVLLISPECAADISRSRSPRCGPPPPADPRPRQDLHVPRRRGQDRAPSRRI